MQDRGPESDRPQYGAIHPNCPFTGWENNAMRTATGTHGRTGLRVAALLVAGALALGACGGDDGDAVSGGKQAGTLLNEGLQAQIQGDSEKAADLFNQVIDADPRNKFAYYNLGFIAQQGGEDAEAESQYRLAISVDANYAPALYNLAILRDEAGARDEAIELYRRATTADPEFAEAFLNLGLALRAAGNAAEAQEALDNAVRLKPELESRIPAA
jgi:tetratricopeptide (TPR) repeat protein